jgi:hypothetical protein
MSLLAASLTELILRPVFFAITARFFLPSSSMKIMSIWLSKETSPASSLTSRLKTRAEMSPDEISIPAS